MVSSKKAFSQIRAIWRRVAFLRPGTSSTARASLPSVWRGSRVKVSNVARKEGTASQSWTARCSAVGALERESVGALERDGAASPRPSPPEAERGKEGWEREGTVKSER